MSFIVGTFQLTAQEGIRGKDFFRHLKYLSSDKLEGRFPGTRGNQKAARYITRHLKRSGIKSFDGNFYQPFQAIVKLEYSGWLKDSTGALFTFNKDYSVYPYSGEGNVQGKVLWVNDTIINYDDPRLKGNWLLVDQPKPSSLAYSIADSAANRGAAGIIFLLREENGKELPLVRLRPGKQPRLTVPVIQVRESVLKQLLENYFPLSNRDKGIYGSENSLKASLKIKPLGVRTNNIVGFIEGSDPILKNEYIILGAHYDHLGWGGYGTGSGKPDTTAIHNGADDNASGTSALVVIARELAKNRELLKRSIIVVAFGAEEEGLLGSEYFVNHLPVARDAVKLMINMDMVGRLNAEKHLYMGGAGTFPGGVELMKQFGPGSGLNLIVHAGGVGGSDHVSFFRKEIPAVGMHTGGHDQYHLPDDDAHLINYQGAELICKYIFRVISALANREEEINFIPVD